MKKVHQSNCPENIYRIGTGKLFYGVGEVIETKIRTDNITHTSYQVSLDTEEIQQAGVCIKENSDVEV